MSAAFANVPKLCVPVIELINQRMAGLVAKMRHVDHGCGIIGAQTQDVSICQRLQTFARLENGQGAKQPGGVKIMCAHGMRHRGDVTFCPQSCDSLSGDVRARMAYV